MNNSRYCALYYMLGFLGIFFVILFNTKAGRSVMSLMKVQKNKEEIRLEKTVSQSKIFSHYI